LQVNEGEQSLQVDAFGDGSPLNVARWIHSAVGWTLQSAQYVHGAFRTGHSVDELLREHDAMKSTQEIQPQ
jgi:hypothetical protein